MFDRFKHDPRILRGDIDLSFKVRIHSNISIKKLIITFLIEIFKSIVNDLWLPLYLI